MLNLVVGPAVRIVKPPAARWPTEVPSDVPLRDLDVDEQVVFLDVVAAIHKSLPWTDESTFQDTRSTSVAARNGVAVLDHSSWSTRMRRAMKARSGDVGSSSSAVR